MLQVHIIGDYENDNEWLPSNSPRLQLPSGQDTFVAGNPVRSPNPQQKK